MQIVRKIFPSQNLQTHDFYDGLTRVCAQRAVWCFWFHLKLCIPKSMRNIVVCRKLKFFCWCSFIYQSDGSVYVENDVIMYPYATSCNTCSLCFCTVQYCGRFCYPGDPLLQDVGHRVHVVYWHENYGVVSHRLRRSGHLTYLHSLPPSAHSCATQFLDPSLLLIKCLISIMAVIFMTLSRPEYDGPVCFEELTPFNFHSLVVNEGDKRYVVHIMGAAMIMIAVYCFL